MFRSVRIQNFRQFKDLELKNLGRINLITGQNNTGKTSLLEALFLLDNPLDPYRTVILANLRGIGAVSAATPELWDWLFLNHDSAHPIHMQATDTDGRRTELDISLSRGSVIPLGVNGGAALDGRSSPVLTSAEPLPALRYVVQSSTGDEQRVQMQWTGQGLALEPDLRRPGEIGFFLPTHHLSGSGEAVRFSYLERAGQTGSVVDALRIIEPRLQQLKVLDLGEGARVHIDLGHPPLVPLAVMGIGLSKLLTIISALVMQENPVMLIDEIGDGFHHSVMPAVWKTIIGAAHKYDVQLFVTTHSLECVKAAADASEHKDAGLVLHRLTRRDGQIRATLVEDEGIRAAVGFGFELR